MGAVPRQVAEFAGVVGHAVSPRRQDRLIHEFAADLSGRTARYVRVIGRSLKTCPDGHPGAGQACWVFADEITLR